jgi:hypothetical protein
VLTSAEFSSDTGSSSGAEDSLFCYVLYPNEDATSAGTCRVTRIEIAKAEGIVLWSVNSLHLGLYGKRIIYTGYNFADTCLRTCTSLQGSTRAQATQRPR